MIFFANGINYCLFWLFEGVTLVVKRIPQHVAIVMDGNGRWAKQRGLLREEGHRAGIDSVKSSIRCCLKHHIPLLSLFAFSSENWSRPQQEVSALMGLFFEALTSETDELVKNGVQIRFTGDKSRFPPELQQLMQIAEERRVSGRQLTLNICINYGGQWDILQAVKAMIDKVEAQQLSSKDIDINTINEHLATYPLPPPDLFIRTSGEHRLSNFFLWQAAYTELYFTETLWPDFNEKAFESALQDFEKRERRFGLIEQSSS